MLLIFLRSQLESARLCYLHFLAFLSSLEWHLSSLGLLERSVQLMCRKKRRRWTSHPSTIVSLTSLCCLLYAYSLALAKVRTCQCQITAWYQVGMRMRRWCLYVNFSTILSPCCGAAFRRVIFDVVDPPQLSRWFIAISECCGNQRNPEIEVICNPVCLVWRFRGWIREVFLCLVR